MAYVRAHETKQKRNGKPITTYRGHLAGATARRLRPAYGAVAGAPPDLLNAKGGRSLPGRVERRPPHDGYHRPG
jgi:hypothetical protein